MWIALLPYLPLTTSIDLSDRWSLQSLRGFSGDWATDWLGPAVRQVAEKHVDRNGRVIKNPTILVDRQRGVTGEMPEEAERLALGLALGFGIVDAFPFQRSKAELDLMARTRVARTNESVCEVLDDLNTAEEAKGELWWRSGTSDNAEVFIWPINKDARISMTYGTIARNDIGGPAVRVVAPTELHMPLFLQLDTERVAAVYDALTAHPPDQSAVKISAALQWLIQAWRNTPSILPHHRIVFLRTAFEAALAGGQQLSKEKLARKLSDHVTELLKGARVEAGELLWQPGLERNIYSIDNVADRLKPFDDLERWFIGFSSARNAIVHEGASAPLEDACERSLLAGPYWSVASRLLRDLVLAEIYGRTGRALWGRG